MLSFSSRHITGISSHLYESVPGLPSLISSKDHTLSLFCFLMYVDLCRGGKMLFLCLLRFRDWRTVNYTNRRQVNRRKGICFLIDVYIFMCIGASQIRGG